jgi:UDP-2,3-diacylglucosamine pyrophosphatase LpxH
MSKVLAFSDNHIFYEHSNYPAMNDFFDYIRLNKYNFDEVVMVGDIFDLWRHNYEDAMKEPIYSNTFYNLQLLIDELADIGINTTLILGNHDYMAKEVIGDDLKVDYKHSYVIENTLYQHGWAFDFVQSFTLLGNVVTPSVYGVITEYFPAFYQQFCRKPSEIPQSEMGTNMHWLDSIYKNAAEFSTKLGMNRIIIGHTHHPFESSTIVDCGDWVDSLSWVEVTDGTPELFKWRETHA